MKVSKNKRIDDIIRDTSDTVIIYGAKRSGNHYLSSYLESIGERCLFRHEAIEAKKEYLKCGKQLIILVRTPKDQIISNAYSIYNVDKDGYGVATKDRKLPVLEPHEIPPQAMGAACKYIKNFTDDINMLLDYPYQFVLYDTITPKKLNSIYIKRSIELKDQILNYSALETILVQSDIEEYVLTRWRMYNLQQTIFYPELAN